MTIKVHQIGNGLVEWTTENELKRALESLGCEVTFFQENYAQIFNSVCDTETPDIIIWTRTKWQPEIPYNEQYAMIQRAAERGVPTVGIHLDRWWGLKRENDLDGAPFFKVGTLYTADGGPHDWESKRINHKWLPPAVDEASCVTGTPQDRYKSQLAFIGSWDGGYHPEHPHRMDLVHFLSETYGDRIQFWPKAGQIRGKELSDLYASVDVVIGDSCFTGTDHYWSDRIPETLGRGGFLIHPYVEGLEEAFELTHDLVTWEPYNWQQLKIKIDYALANPDMRKAVARSGQVTVKARHTYKVRMRKVLADHKLMKPETVRLGKEVVNIQRQR